MQPKEFKYGNTTVIVHSKLVHMDKEEQKNWFETEWQNGNPILKRIVDAAYNCELHRKTESI